ncbi:MAG: hypothetical protein R3E84_02760 [Pseudomonadales bacterium]
MSDGGAHRGVIADAGMPTFILTHWGRDRTKGARMPLPFLVRKLARIPRRLWSGRPRPAGTGKLADVNVIDFQRLALKRPEAVFDLPAGGRRLVQRVRGYEAIIKRGQCTFRGDEATGALPGRLVRGG